MAGTAKRTDPALWERVKAEVTRGDKGGDPGEWSARKAQMAVQQYKKAGGGYEGRKSQDNHLAQWTREEWDTKSGEESGKTGERYLPKAAREALTDEEYARTTAKKRRDTRAGEQFSAQPKDVAGKTAVVRQAPEKAGTRAKGGARGSPAAEPSKSKAGRPAAGHTRETASKSAAKPKGPPAGAAARGGDAAGKGGAR